jgi:hypothetical protein
VQGKRYATRFSREQYSLLAKKWNLVTIGVLQRSKGYMKKFLTALTLAAVLSIATASPTYAAENPFQKFFSSVSNSFQRIVLLLPGDKDGKIVMNQAVQASQNLKSATVESVVTLDLQKQETSVANVKINLGGPFEMNAAADPSSLKQSLHVAAVLSMEGTSLTADADVKVTKDFLYFKLNQVPAVPIFDLTSVKGKWLKTENQPTEQPTSLNADQQQRMKDATTKLLMGAQYSSAKKETKNGKSVYVLDVTLTKQAVTEYTKTILEIQKESITDPAARAKADAKTTEDEVEKMLNNIGDIKATLWIDRSSFFISHMDIPMTYTVEKKEKSEDAQAMTAALGGSTNPFAALDEVEKIKMSFTIDLKDFNQPVAFEEPTDAQDAKEAFQSMMGKSSAMPAPSLGVGSSELPGLTPAQKLQLQKYEKMKLEMDAAGSTTLPSIPVGE